MIDIISIILLLLGSVVILTSASGLNKFPDFYSRMHAAGVSDTLGTLLILGALACQSGWSFVTLKLCLIYGFLFFTSPTSSFSLADSAWLSGLKPTNSNGQPLPTLKANKSPSEKSE